MEYNPSGVYCSICNTHNQWCEHIHPPLQYQIRRKNLIFSTIWIICCATMMLWLLLEILK
jgi:hypothetical protein